MDKKKREALEVALGQIDRHFGKNTVMRLGEDSGQTHVPAISTGSLLLDEALGIGGVPRARALPRYTARSRPASPRCRTTSWQRRRSRAAPPRT